MLGCPSATLLRVRGQNPHLQGPDGPHQPGCAAGKALEQADIVVSKNPDQWVSYYARGLNHLNWPRAFRHSDDAIRVLTRCIEIQQQHGGQAGKPYYLYVHLALGDACAKAGKYKEVRAAWQRGLQAFAGATELKARLDTKDDEAQLAYVESQHGLDKPVDTSLSFLDEER
jgi:tetratricopeptide (TPR) repeat protein